VTTVMVSQAAKSTLHAWLSHRRTHQVHAIVDRTCSRVSINTPQTNQQQQQTIL